MSLPNDPLAHRAPSSPVRETPIRDANAHTNARHHFVIDNEEFAISETLDLCDVPSRELFSFKVGGRQFYLLKLLPDLTVGSDRAHSRVSDSFQSRQKAKRMLRGERCDTVLGSTLLSPRPLIPLLCSDVATRLTARELQIASLVAIGHSNKIIASNLRISEWTVCSHLRRIFVKLGVDNRAAMVFLCSNLLINQSFDESVKHRPI